MSGQMDFKDYIVHQIEMMLVRGYGHKIKFSRHYTYTDILMKDKFVISFVTDEMLEICQIYDVNEDMFKVIVDYVELFNKCVKKVKI